MPSGSSETPKPIPTSFAREAFFAVTSFKFTNAAGEIRHGRFRIRPEEGTEYLTDEAAAAKSENFLFEEIGQRLAGRQIKLDVFVQLAGQGDDVTNAKRDLAGRPPANPLRHDHPDGPRGRQNSREKEGYLRPDPQG